MKLKTCPGHRNGVTPGMAPFFYADCPTCQRKLADGKVRGDEGPIGMQTGWRKRLRWIDHDKVREGRRRELVLEPTVRRGRG